MEEEKKTIGIRGLLAAAVLLCLSSLAVSTEEVKQKQLRFGEKGGFKIVQVADMHYGDGKTTPCRDLLPSQMAGCSDLNTTAFIRRMILAEKPDLIVFTGDNICSDATDAARSLEYAFSPAISAGIPWAAVLGNHDQQSTLSREGLMNHTVTLDHTVSQVNPTDVDAIDGFGNYNVEVHGVEGSGFENKSVLNLYFLDSGDYSTVPAISGYGWIKPSQQLWFQRTSMKLQRAYMSEPEAQEAPAPGLVYFHIPVPEYASVESSNYTGVNQDGISSPSVNSGFFTTMVEAGDVKAVFTGHDHLNDFCGEYTGIQLCYGGGFGYHAYGKAGWPRRSRVVLATLEKTDDGSWGPLMSIKTWKRLDDENLTTIDVEILWSNSTAEVGSPVGAPTASEGPSGMTPGSLLSPAVSPAPMTGNTGDCASRSTLLLVAGLGATILRAFF
ncbi:probable inactive purple acid phosphatase 29 isoform X2 [Rhodamnia argentea]|uniref:Probable inactive purple acid phosphatase 29 isoform X2 n=1 Tax=Rhodamnia argentea TaxID=178133 RepID=A0A8B8MQE5_9MYRT|nr:probable inactive purple acid phosphatase 29 isoform X2 [Rhodamnia argentea]